MSAMNGTVSLPHGLTVADLTVDSASGLLPGVVQDAATGRVLMVGYLDREAVAATLSTGLATFYSRSRAQQWVKGESSGNTLEVQRIEVDCDSDTLLLHCRPQGPTCHTGSVSCFDVHSDAEVSEPEPAGSMLAALDALVATRHAEKPEGSYTTSLFRAGTARIAQKVGEEGVETALAGVTAPEEDLAGEAADLLYHLLVLLRDRGMGLADVEAVLRDRHRPG